MPTPQTFIPIDSTAADSASGTGHAQVSTAIVQRLRQNNRYLIEWRGPTLTFLWPEDTTPAIAEGVPKWRPRLAYAQWACYGPFRYYVPDVGGASGYSVRKVDIRLAGAVSTYPVKVLAFSLQGRGGQSPRPTEFDAEGTTISVGIADVTFSDVAVVPGWNDIYIALQSEADWSVFPPVTDVYMTNNAPFGSILSADSYPYVYSPATGPYAGDLVAAFPLIISPYQNVPYAALRFMANIPDKLLSAETGFAYTIAYAANDDDTCPFAFLAEATTSSDLPANYGGECQFSFLGVLELYSLSITPYAQHPDKVNDPMLRWYQSVGGNVADVFWQGSRLTTLRHAQTGQACAEQPYRPSPFATAIPYWGSWKCQPIGPFSSINLIRESALTVLEEMPTYKGNVVGVEVSLPMMLVYPSFYLRSAYEPPSGVWLRIHVELYNVTTQTVVQSRTFDLQDMPRVINPRDAYNIQSDYWIYKIFQISQGIDWHSLGFNGQPWSHDYAQSLDGLVSGLDRKQFLLPITSYDALLASGDLFCVRLLAQKIGTLNALMFAGPMTARLTWGTR
jgi:hypothetical protein